MKLHHTYQQYSTGHLTLEEAAEQLGKTPKNLKIALTKSGKRLSKAFKVLDGIADGRINTSDAAEVLGVTPREVNRLVHTWNVTRPVTKPSDKTVMPLRADLKWKLRKQQALRFISGELEIWEAGDNAGVSFRMMYRWASDLLKKHLEMHTRELHAMSSIERRRISLHIEDAERFEDNEIRVLNEIVAGRIELEQEALDRAIEQRAQRKVANGAHR